MSIVSARDKEFVDLKETLKTYEQAFYNMGFKDAKDSSGVIIFQARRFRFV